MRRAFSPSMAAIACTYLYMYKTKYISGQDLVSAACVILSSDGPNLLMAHLRLKSIFNAIFLQLDIIATGTSLPDSPQDGGQNISYAWQGGLSLDQPFKWL